MLSRKPFSDSLRCLKIVASGNDKTGKSTWLLQAARTLRGTIQVVLGCSEHTLRALTMLAVDHRWFI